MAKLKYVMYQLNAETLREVKKNPLIIGALAKVHDRRTWAVQKWLKDNHPLLTLYSSLEIISKELGKKKTECIEVKKGTKDDVKSMIYPPTQDC